MQLYEAARQTLPGECAVGIDNVARASSPDLRRPGKQRLSKSSGIPHDPANRDWSEAAIGRVRSHARNATSVT